MVLAVIYNRTKRACLYICSPIQSHSSSLPSWCPSIDIHLKKTPAVRPADCTSLAREPWEEKDVEILLFSHKRHVYACVSLVIPLFIRVSFIMQVFDSFCFRLTNADLPQILSLLKDAHSMPGISQENFARNREIKMVKHISDAGNRPLSLPLEDAKVSLRTVRRPSSPDQMDWLNV